MKPSVEVLLNVCPEIPAIEEVRLKKVVGILRIEESLDDSLTKLVNDKILISWEYCDSNNNPLSDKQLEMESFFEFKNFLESVLKF